MALSRLASQILLALSLGGVVAVSFPSCSRQGEGERCDLAAGDSGSDSDCQDGLVCTEVAGLGGEVCCPPEGVSPTTLACSGELTGEGGQSSVGGGGSGGTTTQAGGSGGTTTQTGGSGGTTTQAGGSGGSGGTG